ncbi:MAG: calcium-binding protein [Candidatus Methylumidiphilus sp.]
MTTSGTYDSSWDEDNDDLWDEKYSEWENRDWHDWLSKNLIFPFEAERKEDLDANPFSSNKDDPFDVGHVVKILALEDEEEECVIIVKVKEGKKTGYVPLCDLEVTSKEDKNFWPVREYVVWFANR